MFNSEEVCSYEIERFACPGGTPDKCLDGQYMSANGCIPCSTQTTAAPTTNSVVPL